MALNQTTIPGVPFQTQASALAGRIRSGIERCLLHDLRALLQPGQAPAPLVLAAALGTILSFIPAPFLDTLLVGVIFARFRQINRSALLAARVVWNDFIVIPLYMPGFRFGMRLLDPFMLNEAALTARIFAFALGLFLLAMAAAIISAAAMLTFLAILDRWGGSSADLQSQSPFKRRRAARTGLPSPPAIFSGKADSS